MPVKPIPDLVKEIKVESNAFITKKKWIPYRFNWQEGYGAFSYARRDIGNVITYVNNQELHHKEVKFRTEYIDMLIENEIEFREEFLFEFLD